MAMTRPGITFPFADFDENIAITTKAIPDRHIAAPTQIFALRSSFAL